MTETPDFAFRYVNLASPKMGTAAIACSDDFFAPMDRMLQDHAAVWKEGEYDENGKWMDGWESRRKRTPGHDWCIVGLGVTGIVHGVDIDTSHFTGNYPPEAALEGCLSKDQPDDNADWTTIVPRCDLQSSSQNFQEAVSSAPVNWLRLNIFPDGGVARLRVYGEPVVDWDAIGDDQVVELSSLRYGGRIVGFNDAHYGDVSAILSAGRGTFMGDGWETRRRREPGHDWIVISLGHAGVVDAIEVDTAFFKGNYPDRCSVQGGMTHEADAAMLTSAEDWPSLLAEEKLQPDSLHRWERTHLTTEQPFNAVRLNIYPDGGVSRFRVFGRLVRE